MKRIYVMGPYTCGDVEANVKRAMLIGAQIIEWGAAPYVPHLSHYFHLHHPQEYEKWMDVDLTFLETCDAGFRIPGYSTGSEREEKRFAELGRPVFYIEEELEAYLKEA